jgi:hypothetical protein
MSEYEVLEEQDNHCHTFVYQVSVIFFISRFIYDGWWLGSHRLTNVIYEGASCAIID